MATAAELRQEFMEYMDKNGVSYMVTDEKDNIVRLAFSGRDDKGGGADTVVYVDFDEQDGSDSVHFVAHRFGKCELANFPAVLVKLNEFNRRWRWVKFWMTQDDGCGYVTADTDAMLTPGSSGYECCAMAFRMSDIVELAILDLGDLIEADDGKAELRAVFEALKAMLGEE